MKGLELGIQEAAIPTWLALALALDQLEAGGRLTPCRADPEPFFSVRRVDREEAAAACLLGCPVLQLCARFADLNGERWGVYGGVDREKRLTARTDEEPAA